MLKGTKNDTNTSVYHLKLWPNWKEKKSKCSNFKSDTKVKVN